MTVDIRIPGQFRSAAGGATSVSVSGRTIAEAFESLCALHAGLREKLFDETGEKKKTVNVYLNKNDIRYLEGLETVVSDGDEVIILPPASGG